MRQVLAIIIVVRQLEFAITNDVIRALWRKTERRKTCQCVPFDQVDEGVMSSIQVLF